MITGESCRTVSPVDEYGHERLPAHPLDLAPIVVRDLDPLDLDALVPGRERDALAVRRVRSRVDLERHALDGSSCARVCECSRSRRSTTTLPGSRSASSPGQELRGEDDPREAPRRIRAARPPAPAARQRAARPRRHVRLLRHRAGGRRRRPRRRLLPQRGLLDGVRPRHDRARHVGARLAVSAGRRAGRASSSTFRRDGSRRSRASSDGEVLSVRFATSRRSSGHGRPSGRRRRVRRRVLRIGRGASRAGRAAAADRARPRAQARARGEHTRSSTRSSRSCATSTA